MLTFVNTYSFKPHIDQKFNKVRVSWHSGGWEEAPENVKECARKLGFNGAARSLSDPQRQATPEDAGSPRMSIPKPDPKTVLPLFAIIGLFLAAAFAP